MTAGSRYRSRMGGGLRAAWGLMGCVILLVGCPGEVTSTGTFENPYGSGVSVGGSGGGGGAGGGAPVCHEPCIAQTSDVFDPGEVYLVGYLPDTEGSKVLAHWSTPGAMVAGLPPTVNELFLQIRPRDGRLIFGDSPNPSLHQFRCDICPFAATDAFPVALIDNDPLVPHPPCDGAAVHALIAPDSTLVLACGQEDWDYYDQEGVLLYTAAPGGRILSLGNDGLALTRDKLLDLGAGSEAELQLKPGSTVVTVRARTEGGFLVVVGPDSSTQEQFDPELHLLQPDGTATAVGSFPPLPEGLPDTSSGGAKLDGRGDLIQVVGVSGPHARIIRRRLGGVSEVVTVIEDELGNPIHGYELRGPTLFTGP